MIDTKTLNLLDSMTKFKTYSKYNNVLEKKFKGFSLKSLIKTCKNPRQFVKAKFLEEFAKKYPYENDQFLKTSNLNSKAKDFLESIKIRKTPQKNTIDPWSRKSSYTKFYEGGTDPFHYNPNYNSIFKNVPCCIIFPLRNEKNKDIKQNPKSRNFRTPIVLSKKIKTESNKENKSNEHKIVDSLTIDNSNDNKINLKIIKNNEKVSQTLPAVQRHNYFLNNINKKINKNNHAFKFSDYTPRKDLILNQSNIISYLEPHDYKSDLKKTLDFGKMQDRNKSVLVNYANLEVPSLNYYNPKYEFTKPRAAQILFTHKDLIEANKKSNKFLIHKLWTSYNFQSRYQLVDNDKLNNK